MRLSVIVPVYNEIQTLPQILPRMMDALPELEKELIFVDDGSKDGSREWLKEQIAAELEQTVQLSPRITAKVIFHQHNSGKGAALRTGFRHATGDILIIQDADLEYDPRDWSKLWRLIKEGWADVVYGSRFYGSPHRVLYFHHLMGNKLITHLINMLCDMTFTDIEVCYKMFRREVIEGLQLTANDFGFEVEFTIKIAMSRRWRIYETGICYYGRTYEEGKKINWKDGMKALGYIVKFRFFGGKPYLS